MDTSEKLEYLEVYEVASDRSEVYWVVKGDHFGIGVCVYLRVAPLVW